MRTLRLPLHEGPGQILDRRQRSPARTDQQAEVVSGGCHLHGVLVELDEADIGIQSELPHQAGYELRRRLTLLLEGQ